MKMTKEEKERHYIACGKTECEYCLMTPCVWDKYQSSYPTAKWWLISDENIQSIRRALGDSGQEEALHDLESGLNTTDEVPDDWKEQGLVKVELTIDQWVLRYGYAVAKSHRYDSAWMLGSLLGVDIRDSMGDPCSKEAFRLLLVAKYHSSPTTARKENELSKM